MLLLPLLLGLLVRSPGDCYFATGRSLVVLETCDVGPATIDALTEAAGPPHPAAARPPAARLGGLRRPVAHPRASAPWAAGTIQARLERAEEERARAVAERVVAEQQRDAAIRELDEARAELARLYRTLPSDRLTLPRAAGQAASTAVLAPGGADQGAEVAETPGPGPGGARRAGGADSSER